MTQVYMNSVPSERCGNMYSARCDNMYSARCRRHRILVASHSYGWYIGMPAKFDAVRYRIGDNRYPIPDGMGGMPSIDNPAIGMAGYPYHAPMGHRMTYIIYGLARHLANNSNTKVYAHSRSSSPSSATLCRPHPPDRAAKGAGIIRDKRLGNPPGFAHAILV